MKLDRIRVALVHDWLTGMRGGEKVLEVFCRLFPSAPIYTLLHVPGTVSEEIASHRIVTSPLQKMPGAARRYRHYLPLLPRFVEAMTIEPVDLVVSISSCVAKGAIPPPGASHASYILSPMRYIYDRYDDYFSKDRAGLATRAAMSLVRNRLRNWDVATAARVNSPAAISTFIAQRIEACYGRQSTIVHPPVEVDRFAAARKQPEDYYLIVSALVPYKNVDLAVEAFRGLDRKLVVAGSGPMLDRLRADCPRNVEFRGWVSDAEIPNLVAGCRAFIFPQVEDFGIAPVEAMAAGRPVIALGEGGALDTIVDLDRFDDGEIHNAPGPTGLFFSAATPSGIANAVLRFEREESRFHPEQIVAWARQFDTSRFVRQAMSWLELALEQPRARRAA